MWCEFIVDFFDVATNLVLSFSGVLGVRLASSKYGIYSGMYGVPSFPWIGGQGFAVALGKYFRRVLKLWCVSVGYCLQSKFACKDFASPVL